MFTFNRPDIQQSLLIQAGMHTLKLHVCTQQCIVPPTSSEGLGVLYLKYLSIALPEQTPAHLHFLLPAIQFFLLVLQFVDL